MWQKVFFLTFYTKRESMQPECCFSPSVQLDISILIWLVLSAAYRNGVGRCGYILPISRVGVT